MERDLKTLKKELATRLHGIPSDRVVFVGVGNRLRGDDGIGPKLIDLLKKDLPYAIDADGAPENITASIKRLNPLAIVFLDAASLGTGPGSMRIIEAGGMEKLEASVHNFSLDVVMEYLKAATGADVFIVGVQPERIGEGEKISPSLETPLKELAGILVEILKKG